MFELFPIDWSGIAAIVSFVMVVLTAISLIHNHRQLKELKRQWNEQNTPCVSCMLEIRGSGLYVELLNTSQVPAHKVKVQLEKHSCEEAIDFDETNHLLGEMSFELPPFSSKHIPILLSTFVDADYSGYITVVVEYSNKRDSFDLYLKEINLVMSEYSTKELCGSLEKIKTAIECKRI